MASPLVPLIFAGAAVYLISSKPKKRSATQKAAPGVAGYKPLPKQSLPKTYQGKADFPPPSSQDDSVDAWKNRQEALKALSTIVFYTRDGEEVPFCTRCNPGVVDGKPGKNTRNAIKAFQAVAGLVVDGQWGPEEDRAMHQMMISIQQGAPLACDPMAEYPEPFGCFPTEDGFGLKLKEGARPPQETRVTDGDVDEEKSEYLPHELLVADGECNYILHQDPKWFDEQNRRILLYALDNMTDGQAANEVHESMMADYAPMCLVLGRDGVGPGVKQFWDVNVAHVFGRLQMYENSEEFLQEDAEKYGLL